MPWTTLPSPVAERRTGASRPVDRLSGLFSEEGSADGAVTVQSEAPEGVELLSLAMDDQRVGSAYRPADRAAVTAWAGTERAMFVGIPQEAELDAPVVVRLTGTGAGRGNGHTVIEAGRHSRATVVLAALAAPPSTTPVSRSAWATART